MINKNTHLIFYIDNFSNELKDLIRSQLTLICHGASKASKTRKRYNYKNTVRSFLERYETKANNMKVGMIGELLSHLFILHYLDDFNRVSPFFNMEEKNITKGFDVILFSNSENEVWITEVKSGELHKNKNSNQTNKNFLSEAKLDLKRRLNQNEESLWDNAINKATIALDNHNDRKEAVIEILEDFGESVVDKQSTSKDKNVILVTNLFANLNDEIEEESLNTFYKSTIKEKLFKKLLVISLQKNTYDRIYHFLKDEAR